MHSRRPAPVRVALPARFKSLIPDCQLLQMHACLLRLQALANARPGCLPKQIAICRTRVETAPLYEADQAGARQQQQESARQLVSLLATRCVAEQGHTWPAAALQRACAARNELSASDRARCSTCNLSRNSGCRRPCFTKAAAAASPSQRACWRSSSRACCLLDKAQIVDFCSSTCRTAVRSAAERCAPPTTAPAPHVNEHGLHLTEHCLNTRCAIPAAGARQLRACAAHSAAARPQMHPVAPHAAPPPARPRPRAPRPAQSRPAPAQWCGAATPCVAVQLAHAARGGAAHDETPPRPLAALRARRQPTLWQGGSRTSAPSTRAPCANVSRWPRGPRLLLAQRTPLPRCCTTAASSDLLTRPWPAVRPQAPIPTHAVYAH